MLTKVYAIENKSVVSVRIAANNGKAYIICNFERGCPNAGRNYRPATYSSSSYVEQNIIEDSPLFKNGTIKVLRSFGKAEEPAKKTVAAAVKPKAATPAPAAEKPAEIVLSEVNSRESLIEALKAHGAKASVLASDEKMQAYIEKHGIDLPNFQF